ncbi:MAG: M3 family peptidase, partial [Pseudomonadota bacterium]
MNLKYPLIIALLSAGLVACGDKDADPQDSEVKDTSSDEISVTDAELAGNPFRQEWDTPYGVPPFAVIENAHYMPALKKAVLEQREDIDAIINNPEAPTFENTIVALELAGEELGRVARTFFNIVGTELNDELQAIQGPVSGMLSKENSAIMLNDKLFERVQAVYQQKDNLDLDEQGARLIELWHRSFIRSGAGLDPEAKTQ